VTSRPRPDAAGDTRAAVASWEALLRAQVTVLRRLAGDDVWDPISMREYDVLFTLSRCPANRARLHELNRHCRGWWSASSPPGTWPASPTRRIVAARSSR
jgi:hypothetical protein